MSRSCFMKPFSSIHRNKHSTAKSFPEDLLPFISGRRRHERVDSVTEAILRDRQAFRKCMDDFPLQKSIKNYLVKYGYDKRRKKDLAPGDSDYASQGQAVHLTSTSENWPVFTHILPEIAFAGHSNSGKSTLVNVLAGYDSKKGPASVSDRAGWTDQICFYQVGKRPPMLIIADMPGYGHAIATDRDKKEWQRMTRSYLADRVVLSRCCVLVDCSRGLCDDDLKLLTYLSKIEVPWQVLLTKTDLLDTEDLSKSIALTEIELLETQPVGTMKEYLWNNDNESILELNNSKKRLVSHAMVRPVSARTGAGIHQLWKDLIKCTSETSIKFANSLFDDIPNSRTSPSNESEDVRKDTRVREHINANLLRKNSHLKS